MNARYFLKRSFDQYPTRTALVMEDGKSLSFSELKIKIANCQSFYKNKGITKNDYVLAMCSPSVDFFVNILALMSSGIPILFIEPWLELKEIEEIVNKLKPKVFLSQNLGKLFGLRMKSIRDIPHWLSPSRTYFNAKENFFLEQTTFDHPVITGFTSGTTGKPKGVVRNQKYMWDMHYVLSENETRDNHEGLDLTCFPNVVFFRLGTGRGSIYIKNFWKKSYQKSIYKLCKKYLVHTVTSNPAFIKNLMDSNFLSEVKTFYIGGALSDVCDFEKIFSLWPNANVFNIYGSTEVEPICITDARLAVQKSKLQNHFQVTYFGHPVDIVNYKVENRNLWVQGPNVTPEYLFLSPENDLLKRRDQNDKLWHKLGDRIIEDTGLWFQGRLNQDMELFTLEQKIYSYLQSSSSLIHRDPNYGTLLIGEDVVKSKNLLVSIFPQLDDVIDSKIFRDRRHHSRINREKTILVSRKKWRGKIRNESLVHVS